MNRRTATRQIVLLLAVVVCLSALASGTVAAENVTISNSAEGEVGDHTWNTTVSDNGTLEYLILNYTGSGANLTDESANIEKGEITVNGTTVTVDHISYPSSTKANVSLGSNVSISANDTITFTAHSIRNPSTNGTYTASIELNNTSETFVSSSESFEIVEGGTVSGILENQSGSTLGDGRVDIFNSSTDATVTAYDADSSTGEYSARIPAGTYTFQYDAPGYVVKEETITINTSETKANRNVSLERPGFINGTVVDSDGNTLAGIELIADPEDGSGGDSNTSASDGSFSLRVTSGTYDIVAVNNPDYEFEIITGVSATSGTTTTKTITLTQSPEKGTISGQVVDSDGTGVSNVRVSATDASYQYYNFTTTNATGHFSMKVPEATYRIRTNSTPTVRESGISVTANQTASPVELEVPERAYLTGQVTNSSGPISDAAVVADSGDSLYVDFSTNSSGYYNITAPPGEYGVAVIFQGTQGDQTASSKIATVDVDATNVTNFTAQPVAVTNRSVSILNGPGDETKIGVEASPGGGVFSVQLTNKSSPPSNGAPQELAGLGVTDQTEFEINVTVTNYSADSLLWAIDEAEYSTSRSANDPNATNITIRGNATTLQANISSASVGPLLTKDPADVQWPTEQADRADVGFNETVFVGILDFNTTPGTFEESLNGASVTTNAQRFSAPSVRNETLRIWIGAPSKTVEGEDHSGFYQATIPDSQLDAWGVEDPESELKTFYKGSQTDFTVEETDNGARIRLDNIGYSAGFVEVEANPTSDDGGSSSGGSSSSSGDSGPSTTASIAGDRLQLSITDARAGQAVSVDVPNSPAMDRTGVRMRSVELTLARSGDGSLDVDTADAPDESPPDGTEALFAYEVSTDLTDADIDRATVRLTVQRDRVADGESVTALRRTDDGWEPVDTVLVATSAEEFTYAVETTEFSTFAMVAQTGEESTTTAPPTVTATSTATATPTTPTATATTEPPVTTTSQPGFGVVVAVFALVVSAILARRRG